MNKQRAGEGRAALPGAARLGAVDGAAGADAGGHGGPPAGFAGGARVCVEGACRTRDKAADILLLFPFPITEQTTQFTHASSHPPFHPFTTHTIHITYQPPQGSTLAPGTSYLLREVTAGRPTSCIMLMFQHCRQSFTGYLQVCSCVYVLMSDVWNGPFSPTAPKQHPSSRRTTHTPIHTQLFPLYASFPSTTANPSSRSGGGAIAGLQMPPTQPASVSASPPSQQQRPTRPAHILGILREVPNFSYDVRQALQLQETAAQPQLQPPLPPPSPPQQQPQPGFGYAAYHPPAVPYHQQHEQQQQGQGGQY